MTLVGRRLLSSNVRCYEQTLQGQRRYMRKLRLITDTAPSGMQLPNKVRTLVELSHFIDEANGHSPERRRFDLCFYVAFIIVSGAIPKSTVEKLMRTHERKGWSPSYSSSARKDINIAVMGSGIPWEHVVSP